MTRLIIINLRKLKLHTNNIGWQVAWIIIVKGNQIQWINENSINKIAQLDNYRSALNIARLIINRQISIFWAINS